MVEPWRGLALLHGSFRSPTGEACRRSCPNSLAESLAVTTGPDGNATLDYLAPGHQLGGYALRRPRSARKTSRSWMGPAAKARARRSPSSSSPRATWPAG